MILLGAVFLYGCRVQREEVTPQKNTTILIEKAKKWFKNQQKTSVMLKSTDTTKIVYQWNEATWQKHYQMDFVEVPILYEGHYLSASLNLNKDNKSVQKQGQQRLLLRLNDNDSFSAFQMFVFADSSYLSKNPNGLTQSKLENRTSDFSGDIYFSVNASNFLGAYHFSDNIRVGTSITDTTNESIEVRNCISIIYEYEPPPQDLLARSSNNYQSKSATSRVIVVCMGVAGPNSFPCLTCGDSDYGNGSGGGNNSLVDDANRNIELTPSFTNDTRVMNVWNRLSSRTSRVELFWKLTKPFTSMYGGMKMRVGVVPSFAKKTTIAQQRITFENGDPIILLEISKDKVNSLPDFVVAFAILHEMYHGNIDALVIKTAVNNNVASSLNSILPLINNNSEQVLRDIKQVVIDNPALTSDGDIHHNLFSQDAYRTELQNAAKSFNNNQNADYEALGWVGVATLVTKWKNLTLLQQKNLGDRIKLLFGN